MPELPEVEAARRALEAHCVGRRIARCAVADDPKVVAAGAGVTRVAFERAMVGRNIVAARRRGKNLWLQLDAPPFPSFQFGMAGAIYIKGVPVTKYKRSVVSSTDEWPSKYSKFFVELDNGLEFSFTDKRRFARVRLFEDPETMPPISELGPDALFEPMSVDNFADSLKGKKIGIKALLLDQSFISGIGNWIADEVLYQSRMHPLQVASNISREGCEALHRSIQEVVKFAVEVDADCDRFPLEWLFHHRWGKKPGKVNGEKIEFITAGGRTTAYVPQLQKLTGMQSGKIVAVNPDQVAENSYAKETETDGEGVNLNTRKRVATSRAARGHQNKDAIGAHSRKTRKNGDGKGKPGTEYSAQDGTETSEPNKFSTDSNGEQGLHKPVAELGQNADHQVIRRSSRNKAKPSQVNKSEGRLPTVAGTPCSNLIRAQSTGGSSAIRQRPPGSQHRVAALEARIEDEIRKCQELSIQLQAERAEREAERAEREAQAHKLADITQFLQGLGAHTGFSLPLELLATPPPPTAHVTPPQSAGSNNLAHISAGDQGFFSPGTQFSPFTGER